jgi:hypothetical protein
VAARSVIAASLLLLLAAAPRAVRASDWDDGGLDRDLSENAQEALRRAQRLPIPFVAQPLTLPAMILRLTGEWTYTHSSVRVGAGTTDDSSIGAAVDAAFGITNDLEVDALVLPLVLAPDLAYGDPFLVGTYRFLRGNYEAGGRLGIHVPTKSGENATLVAGLPFLFRFGTAVRLDTGIELDLTFASELLAALAIPLTASVDLSDQLDVQLITGWITGAKLDFNAAVVPLGVAANYTVEGRFGPMFALGPFFRFPALFVPGSAGDKLSTSVWEVGAAVRIFVYL